MKNISNRLIKILNDKIHGSSELANLLNEYFLSIRTKPTQIKESIRLVQKKLGHFEVINSYLNNLKSILNKKDKNALTEFLKEYVQKENKKVESICNKIYPKVKYFRTIITLSRSKTVIDVLKFWYKKNKKLKVVICESRPKYEGRLTASELIKVGIKVELITDSMMGIIVPRIDAAIVGADSVLKNGNVINKVGSKALALLCREYKKPFYVVTTKSKISNRKSFKQKTESPKEVLSKSLKNLVITNIYFEEIEKKLITKTFTD